MKRTATILKRVLMAWGVVSLLGMLVVTGRVAYHLSMTDTEVEGDDQDVQYVINWYGAANAQDAEIVHSYTPTGSWSGDYEKMFAVRFADMDEEEVAQRDGVSRGDELPPVVLGAVEFVTDLTNDERTPWFPSRAQLLSKEYYAYPVRMVHQGTYPDSVHILFIRPADKMVFFVALKI